MIILLNILFVSTIAFIIYWFWYYKPETAVLSESGEVTIKVINGVYQPDRIAAVAGQPITINFELLDDSHCAKTVIFNDFNESLSLDKANMQKVTITPDKTGEFVFACPMAMYKGVLEVQDGPAIDITVDAGVFEPRLIEVPVGKTVNLRFTRKDASRCAQTIIFPELDLAKELPLNDPVMLPLTLDKAGEYTFSCEMGMYQGKIIAKD